jgi:hypothetical protein
MTECDVEFEAVKVDGGGVLDGGGAEADDVGRAARDDLWTQIIRHRIIKEKWTDVTIQTQKTRTQV